MYLNGRGVKSLNGRMLGMCCERAPSFSLMNLNGLLNFIRFATSPHLCL